MRITNLRWSIIHRPSFQPATDSMKSTKVQTLGTLYRNVEQVHHFHGLFSKKCPALFLF